MLLYCLAKLGVSVGSSGALDRSLVRCPSCSLEVQGKAALVEDLLDL